MRSTSASSAEEALPGWLWTAVTAVLCLMLGYALVAMPLAMASALRPLPALGLSLVAAGSLFALLRRPGPGPGPATRPDARVAAAAAVVIAVAATLLNVRYSSEHVIADRDPGIYLWFGRWLADHGSLFLDNPRHLFPHVTGGVLAQCPETCRGAPGDRLYVQFLHLLPATLAAGAWIGGSALMVKVNAVIGGLSLVTFHSFATRLVRPWFALAATVALALDFVQVYFARDTYSELLAQLFLFGGLLVLWEARRTLDARRGAVAGLLLGATCMARIDSFVYLIPFIAYLFWEASARERLRFAAAVGGGVALTALLGAIDLRFFAYGYYRHQRGELHPLAIAIAAEVVAGALLLATRRLRPRLPRPSPRHVRRAATLAAGAIVVAAAYAYLVRPHVSHPHHSYDQALANLQREQGLDVDAGRSYAESTMRWLGWYLGPVALGAGVAGLAFALRHAALARRRSWLPFLGIVVAISALYVARPSIFPNQVWAMRRFLPVTIPGLLLLAALAAQALFDWLRPRPPRVLRLALPAALLAGVVGVPAYQLAGLADAREQAGGLTAMSQLCGALPPRAAVWTIPGPDETQLLEPVHAFCGVPVAQAPPGVDDRLVDPWAVSLARSGRRAVLISTGVGPLRTIAGLHVPARPAVVFRYRHLEETLTQRPTRQEHERLAIWVAEP